MTPRTMRDRRVAAGATLDVVAKAAGVSTASVRKYELEPSALREATRAALAAVYESSLLEPGKNPRAGGVYAGAPAGGRRPRGFVAYLGESRAAQVLEAERERDRETARRDGWRS